MKNFMLYGVAGAVLLAAVPALAQGIPRPRVIDYPKDLGVVLGQGWNTQAVSNTQSVCVIFQMAESHDGQAVSFDKAQVSDRYSLSRSLDVSAEWQLNSGLIAGNTVDAKAKYASKTAIDESSLVVTELVTVDNGYVYAAPMVGNAQQFGAAVHSQSLAARNPAEVQKAMGIDPRAVHAQSGQKINALMAAAKGARQKHEVFANGLTQLYKQGGSTVASVRLTDDMAVLYNSPKKADKDEFRRICGDGFIAGIQQGGELAATYTFRIYSKFQQDNISAKLGFKVDGFVTDYSGSASITHSISQNHLNQNLRIDYFAQGGSGEVIPATLEQIDAAISNFAKAVEAKPYPYKIAILDYATLPNGKGNPMADMSNFDKVAWEYAKADQTYHTVTALIEDYNALGAGTWPAGAYLYGRWGYRLDDLQTIQTTALNRLNSLKPMVQTCLGGKSSCPQPDVWDDLPIRAVFPLPIDNLDLSGRDQWALAQMLFDNPVTYYTPLVVNYWIKSANAERCGMSTDPLFCQPDAAFNDLPAKINAGRGKVSFLAGYNCIGNSGTQLGYQTCPKWPADKTGYVHYTDQQQIQGDDDRSLCLGEHSDHTVAFQSCSDRNLWTYWTMIRAGDKFYFQNNQTKRCLSDQWTADCYGAETRKPYGLKIQRSLPD